MNAEKLLISESKLLGWMLSPDFSCDRETHFAGDVTSFRRHVIIDRDRGFYQARLITTKGCWSCYQMLLIVVAFLNSASHGIRNGRSCQWCQWRFVVPLGDRRSTSYSRIITTSYFFFYKKHQTLHHKNSNSNSNNLATIKALSNKMNVSHEEDDSRMDEGTTALSFSCSNSIFPEKSTVDICYESPTAQSETAKTVDDNNTRRIKQIFRTTLDNNPDGHGQHQDDEENFNFLLRQSPGKVLEVLMDDDHDQEFNDHQGLIQSSLSIKNADCATYPSQQLRKPNDTTKDEETKLFSFPPFRITTSELGHENNKSNKLKSYGDVNQFVMECSWDALGMEIDDVQLDEYPSELEDKSFTSIIGLPSTISLPNSPDEANQRPPLPRSGLQLRTSMYNFSQLAAEFEARKTRILHGKPENFVHPFFKKYLPLHDSLRPVVGFLLQMEESKFPHSLLEHACGIVTSNIIQCQTSHDIKNLAGKVFSILTSDLDSKGINIASLFQESEMKLSERSLELNEMQEKIQLFFRDSSPDDEFFSHPQRRNDHGYDHHPPHHQDWHHPHLVDKTMTAMDCRLTYRQPDSIQDLLKLAIAYGALQGGRVMSSSQNDSDNPNSLISATFSEFIDGGHSYLHHMTDDEKLLLWETASSRWPGPRFEA